MKIHTATFLNLLVLTVIGIIGFLLSPQHANAYDGKVAGWIPYWAAEDGIDSAIKNIDSLDTIYLFVIEVEADGRLVNKVDFDDEHWEDLFEVADDENVELIPTIAWFDGEQIDFVLSNKTLRNRHIKLIEDLVDDYDFAGVDIDYEGKKSETINNFSLFLEDLKDELGRRKELVCTLEARTPAESLYRDVPKNIKYANDYDEINNHCDRVQLMAYDQQRADIS